MFVSQQTKSQSIGMICTYMYDDVSIYIYALNIKVLYIAGCVKGVRVRFRVHMVLGLPQYVLKKLRFCKGSVLEGKVRSW